jgi:hypothetical protein
MLNLCIEFLRAEFRQLTEIVLLPATAKRRIGVAYQFPELVDPKKWSPVQRINIGSQPCLDR